MPVPHNLLADLKLTQEEVDQRKKDDPRLSSLFDKYKKIDATVVEAESNYTHDDVVKKHKEARLQVKDEIVRHLGNPGAR
ncbi:hypothetical protein [Pseudomonas sp. R5(2019)]|uniref:hypothetical protein n=1 Tax=Pseudomonas sp. R5(2019) TaxID=2697566 RepID=UPI00141326BD|nr:hypothetical protein [Pseudomonas sp. R5(2019)]NBA95862.1 hypothetical protein [Pseudomonas sp. R5(2019)]